VKIASSIAFIQFPQDFSKELQQRVLGSWDLSGETSTKSLAYANIDNGSEYIPLKYLKRIRIQLFIIMVDHFTITDVLLVSFFLLQV
jgi:hypothetical protein